jgi:hypothetical protein
MQSLKEQLPPEALSFDCDTCNYAEECGKHPMELFDKLAFVVWVHDVEIGYTALRTCARLTPREIVEEAEKRIETIRSQAEKIKEQVNKEWGLLYPSERVHVLQGLRGFKPEFRYDEDEKKLVAWLPDAIEVHINDKPTEVRALQG